MSSNLPSFNPANKDTQTGALQEILAIFARSFECCLPAIVESYDRATHTAIVKPALNMVTTQGDQIERASLQVTVQRLLIGGYLIDLPINVGDTGWMVASDRDTSTFKETSQVSKPNTKEAHKYSAGFFIPDSFGSFTLAAEDDGRMVIQNLAGTEKISIGESDTKITSAALTIDCPMTTLTGDATIGGIVFSTHVHSGVTPGGGVTGVPQ